MVNYTSPATTAISDTRPGESDGKVWVDTSENPPEMKLYDSATGAFVPASANETIVSQTEPTPEVGKIWFEPIEGGANIYAASSDAWEFLKFLPAIPDNPVGHFDATELSLSDGSSVSTWPDESSEGNDLSAGTTPTYRSSGINGHPAVEFDGTNDFLDVKTATYPSPRTVVMAVEHTDPNDDFAVPFDGGGSNEHRSFVTSNGNVRLVSGSVDISDSTDARDTTSIFVFEVDGGDSRIRRNGQTLVTGGNTSDSDLTGFTVGARGDTSSNFYPGYIGELLVYNRELTNGEVNGVESSLSGKWGITI